MSLLSPCLSAAVGVKMGMQMGAQARLGAVIVQCRDPEALAVFWCGLLGFRVSERLGDPPHFVDCLPVDPDAAGPYLGFERVGDPQPGSQVHLDVEPDDIGATTAWVEANGGSRAPAGDISEHGERWRVMRDPEGNEFCLWFS